MSNSHQFKITYSPYFARDIMCVKYINDDEWYFCFIDKQKQPVSGIRRAKSKHSCFFWHS